LRLIFFINSCFVVLMLWYDFKACFFLLNSTFLLTNMPFWRRSLCYHRVPKKQKIDTLTKLSLSSAIKTQKNLVAFCF
jgi:hypothetical protein